MKVLWFTNIPMPEMLGKEVGEHAGSGGWMMAMLDQLRSVPDLEISVACLMPGIQNLDIRAKDGVRFLLGGQGSRRRFSWYQNFDERPDFLMACQKIVEEVNPDIIHIHGTERPYGLLSARRMISVPVVISLQGLLHEYIKFRNYFGVSSLPDIVSCHHPLQMVMGYGPVFDFFRMRRSARRELEILESNRWFMGRTLWDRSHLWAVNPSARYFDVPELLRSSFYAKTWQLQNCQRYKIILTNARSFVRGTDVLLDAVALLKEEFPNVSVSIAGSWNGEPYTDLLKKKIKQMGLDDYVTPLGRINEQVMSDALTNAHVYVIPSLLENSPNSLCEAQLVGVPCVASYTGGIPSLVEEGVSGLLFPPGDAAVLAKRIREIFLNDQLAQKIGAQARETALKRHNLAENTQKVINIYQSIVKASKK